VKNEASKRNSLIQYEHRRQLLYAVRYSQELFRHESELHVGLLAQPAHLKLEGFVLARIADYVHAEEQEGRGRGRKSSREVESVKLEVEKNEKETDRDEKTEIVSTACG
jgi:hypothetical protein